MDVEALTCVSQHADKISQIGGLVTVEEVFLQVEGFEDEIRVLLVQPVFAKEWVTTSTASPGSGPTRPA